jgi:hypothetical protein
MGPFEDTLPGRHTDPNSRLKDPAGMLPLPQRQSLGVGKGHIKYELPE